MASPTTNLRLEKLATGEKPGTWDEDIRNAFDMLDTAIAGTSWITTTGGTTTLADSDYTDDAAKSAVLVVDGVLVSNATIEVPQRDKIYAVRNDTTGSFTLTIKTPTGTGINVPQGSSCFIRVDALTDDVDFLTAPTTGTSGVLPISQGGTGATTALTARDNLGLEIGADVQAWDADLGALAALSGVGVAVRTAANTWAQRSLAAPATGLTISNNDGVSGNPTFALANDLAALEGLSGTNTIYYRSAADTWTAVTIGGLLSFSGGTLNIVDAELTALAGLVSAADRLPYFTGSGTAALATFTTAGRNLIDDATTTDQLTTLGLTANARSLVTAADYAAMRALLDLEVGTDFLSPAAIAASYQPLDADLTSWAGVTRAAGLDTFATTPSTANLMSLLTDDAAGLGTFMVTPSSANLFSLLTTKTGSGGSAVFATAPVISDIDLTGLTDVQQSFAFTGDISPSQITADQNDYNPTGLSTASVLRLNTNASRNITGLAGGADGRILLIHNIGTTDLVLKDENVGSVAANRLALAADVTLGADQSAMIQYDATSTRWRLIGGTGSGGGGVTISATAPGAPNSGDLWYDTTDGIFYLYLNDGSSSQWIDLSAGGGGLTDGDKGDITVSGSGATWTVDNNAITDAKIRDSAALSVIGRSANSTGDPADIAAASDGQVLRRSGTTLGFGAVDLASANAITGTLPVGNGGTGQTTAAEAVGELIQACTEDTAPDNAADFFGVYDASADTGSKVKFSTVIREKLTAARTYYVRTDGSDSNTGLANTSGGAFLTIQKAIDTAASLDMVTFDVTIQIADGTYTGANTLKKTIGSGTVIIQGNSGTPANVLISTTSANCFSGTSMSSTYTIKDLEMRTTTSGHGVDIDGAGLVNVSNIRCGAKGTNGAHLRAIGGGVIKSTSSYTVSGGGGFHLLVGYLGTIATTAGTVTYSGTPNFSVANVYADALGYINGAGSTQSGAATGTRYVAQQNGVINTAGGGASFWPGNVAGSTSTGGQYA